MMKIMMNTIRNEKIMDRNTEKDISMTIIKSKIE